MISVVSFPLLVDRDVGAAVAITTSVRAVAANPVTMAAWGFIVAALLFLGSLPAFMGLAVVMPVLGHATWHLYRKAVDAERVRRRSASGRRMRDGTTSPISRCRCSRDGEAGLSIELLGQ